MLLAAQAMPPATAGITMTSPATPSHGAWMSLVDGPRLGEARDQSGRHAEGDAGGRQDHRLDPGHRPHRARPGTDGDEDVALVATLGGRQRQPDGHDEQRDGERAAHDDPLQRGREHAHARVVVDVRDGWPWRRQGAAWLGRCSPAPRRFRRAAGRGRRPARG